MERGGLLVSFPQFLPSALLTFSDLTSSTSALHISVYDRNKAGEGFLGMVAVKPVLKDGYCLDNWYKLGTRGTEHVTGELWVQVAYTAIRVSPHCLTYYTR
jgi:hypothetical protein